MSTFHYVTFKYVIIKDKRLGVAYYIMLVLILMYTLAQMVIHKAYLEVDVAPRATLRLVTTRPPLVEEEDLPFPPYCCDNQTSENLAQQNGNISRKCHKCRILGALGLNWPTESKAASIATFIKENYEKRVNKPFEYHNFINIRADEYFTVNPEYVLFKVEHSMSALREYGTYHTASHRMMKGFLRDQKGNILKQLSNGMNSKVDKIRLYELLQAANVSSLDLNSDALNANGRTYRENGLILRVNIHYNNIEGRLFGTGPLEYNYWVEKAPYSDYRTKEEILIINSSEDDFSYNKRLVRKRYCTRVEFTQSGKIGKFSFPNFLLQLVASMGLLTLSATVIDTVALYIVPAKSTYRKYVYDSSPDLRSELAKYSKTNKGADQDFEKDKTEKKEN